jgi:formylglycine-generating enzyme required for sulfatase activity
MKKTILLLATTLLLNAENITNSIGMEFVKIPSGRFTMGTSVPNCPKDDPFTDRNEYDDCLGSVSKDETPAQRKSVKGFYMQTTEVTQLQWYKVMGNNPAHFKKEKLGYDSRNNPIESVSWYDAKRFVKKLNKKEGTNAYFLPTETQWEYAARAGSSTKWHFGNTKRALGDYAWYGKNSRNKTHPVAKKKPNKWGLYDMHGNVREWTNSCYTQRLNRGCYEGGKHKVLRGGSWIDSARDTRSADRSYFGPTDTGDSDGFRVARTLP